MTMTDTPAGATAGGDLTYPCTEDGCDFEAPSKLRLGAHRRQAHGIAGTSKRTRRRRSSAARGERPAAASPASRTGAVREVRTQLVEMADRIEERAPRTAERLRLQSDRIAAAGTDLWADTEMGERIVATVGDDDKEKLVRLAVAVAPVALTALVEVVAPRLFGPILNRLRTGRRRRVVDDKGQPWLVDKAGNVYHPDTGELVGNLNDDPSGGPGQSAPESEPAPASPSPPAPEPAPYPFLGAEDVAGDAAS